jgi:hypothetical protein
VTLTGSSDGGGASACPARRRAGTTSTAVTAMSGTMAPYTQRHPGPSATAAASAGPTSPGTTHTAEMAASIRPRSSNG